MDLGLRVGSPCGGGSGPGSGRAPGSGSKKPIFPIGFLALLTKTLKNFAFIALFTQTLSFGLKFASQVVTLRGVSEGWFSKRTVFVQPGNAAERSASARHIEFPYHWKSEP